MGALISIGVFMVITLLLVVFVFVKTMKRGLTPKDVEYFLRRWNKVSDMAQSDPKHAILDADKLLDQLLSKKGYNGTLGEKLKKAEGLFSDLNGVWTAHKMRNRIAHEFDVKLHPAEVRDILRRFKRAFTDLGLKL